MMDFVFWGVAGGLLGYFLARQGRRIGLQKREEERATERERRLDALYGRDKK